MNHYKAFITVPFCYQLQYRGLYFTFYTPCPKHTKNGFNCVIYVLVHIEIHFRRGKKFVFQKGGGGNILFSIKYIILINYHSFCLTDSTIIPNIIHFYSQ